MNATDILALITMIVFVLHSAARIPVALTELLNACKPLVRAARELAATLRADTAPSHCQSTDIERS